MLKYLGGDILSKILRTLVITDDTERIATFVNYIGALDVYFKPKRNDVFDRHKFRQMKLEEGESIAAYLTRWKSQGKFCNYANYNFDLAPKM